MTRLPHDSRRIATAEPSPLPPKVSGDEVERVLYALQYARNLIGPDEIIDAALAMRSTLVGGE